MNVVLVTQYFYPETGATQNRMASFARALTRGGHQVTVLTEFPNHPHGAIRPEYKGRWIERDCREGYAIVRVRVLASPNKSFWRRISFYTSFMIMSIIGALRAGVRAHLVIATSPPIFAGAAGWVLAVLRRAPFVLDVRDLWPDAAIELGELRNPILVKASRRLEAFLYQRASFILAATRGMSEAIEARTDTPTQIVSNGTEPSLFSPVHADPSLRKNLGLQGKFLAVFAGNLGIAQDLDTIVETARLLRHEEKFVFLFIGAGPELAHIQAKVRQLRLDNVRFHPQVPVEEIPAYLLAADVLLVTLRNLSLFSIFVPSKLYDCMSCQRAVLTNIPGEVQRIVEQSGAGLVVPAGDARSMADAMSVLLDDPERRRIMGENGRNLVSSKFDRDRIGDGLVKELEARFEVDMSPGRVRV